MSLTYEQAKDYLTDTLRFGIKLGLHRMKRLMHLLGDPQEHLVIIHVAGTNGKGSVSNYLASVLAASDKKTGLYTSPYINRLTERIRVLDGKQGLAGIAADETSGEISETDFARQMTRVKNSVVQMISEGEEQPTEFEILTALAFCHFAEQLCDIVVLETGLGGRLDSTNIIQKPVACLITALGFDHMDRLGSTMREIAAEKAGIIKKGVPVYLFDPHQLHLKESDRQDACDVIRQTCEANQAKLHLVKREQVDQLAYSWSGQSFYVRPYQLQLETTLLGIHQPLNALMAASVCLDSKLADEEAVAAGIKAARWPARMELLSDKQRLLIDGAHNPQSCEALRQTLDRLLSGQDVILIAGMLKDKQTEDMLAAVINDKTLYDVKAVICTSPDNPRALPAEVLAGQVRQLLLRLRKTPVSGYNEGENVYVINHSDECVRQALKLSGRKHTAICAFGSLYLMGALRDSFRQFIHLESGDLDKADLLDEEMKE